MTAPSNPKVLHIAGPMTGIEESNYPAFNAAEVELRAAGYDVLNPVRSDVEETAVYDYVDETTTWDAYMRNGINQLIRATGIVLLPGWLHSRGATLEVHIGQQLGLDIRDLTEWLHAVEESAA